MASIQHFFFTACYPYLQEPYVNQSAMSVQRKFSLSRTYILFRTLGLRHLTVVNHHNQVVGIITRKDLMGYNLEEQLLQFTFPNMDTTDDILLET